MSEYRRALPFRQPDTSVLTAQIPAAGAIRFRPEGCKGSGTDSVVPLARVNRRIVRQVRRTWRRVKCRNTCSYCTATVLN